jgi:general secretion pathway protein D
VAASVSYLDVGLKLEVEPSVTLDDQVSIKVGLEVSNIVREVPGPEGSLAYQLGTRSATTTLRLKNGETQVLAGLINDEDRTSTRRMPGLGDLPLVGRLFSSQRDSGSKTEIVLLITPRIVRNVVPPVSARDDLPAGTEASIGAVPLRMAAATSPGSLTLSAAGAAAPAAGGFAAVRPAVPPAAVPASAAGEPQAEELELRLSAPDTAQAGATLTLTLALAGRGRHDGGVVDIAYDAKALEPVGFSGQAAGQATAALPPGALPGTLSLTFRVKPEARGMASVAVTGVNLESGGRRLALPVRESATVTITP